MKPLSLPIGVHHNGEVLRDFTLAPPRGTLRTDLRDSQGGAAGMDAVALQHVLSSLGPIQRPNAHLVRKLTDPDRAYIHAFCTALRYEGKLPVKVKCECEHEIERTVDFDRVEMINEGKITPRAEKVNGVERMVVDVSIDVRGRTFPAVVALSCADDLLAVSKAKTPGQMDMQLLARSYVSLNGRAFGAGDLRDVDAFLGVEGAWSAGLDALDALILTLRDIDRDLYQLDPEAIVSCPRCGQEHTVRIEFDRWLYPFSPPKGRTS